MGQVADHFVFGRVQAFEFFVGFFQLFRHPGVSMDRATVAAIVANVLRSVWSNAPSFCCLPRSPR